MHAAYLDVSVHLLRGLLSRTHLLYAVVRGGWPVVVHLARGAGGSASASLGGFAENGCLVGRGASRGHGMSPVKGWTSTRETMRARCRATRQTAASEVAGVVYPRFPGAAEREICSEAQTVQFRLSKRCAERELRNLRAPCPNPSSTPATSVGAGRAARRAVGDHGDPGGLLSGRSRRSERR